MTLNVHFYSIAKELAQASERAVVLPDNARVQDALAVLFREIPRLESIRSSCLYAIGTEYAPVSRVLHEGDVLSIIPPMQGG